MKIEIEFKTESVNGSQISQKLGSHIINSVKQQGLDSREFSIEKWILDQIGFTISSKKNFFLYLIL